MNKIDLFNVAGKRVLITGSSRGLGKTLAEGFLRAGAVVILNGRSKEALREIRQEFISSGFQPEIAAFDVLDENAVQTAIDKIQPIDVLINNAGIQRRAALHETPLELWNDVLHTNLTSAFLVAREVAQRMLSRGRGGKIINICSLMSGFGRPTTGPYTASKGGLKMLTQAMCADWARFDIQINGIAPGYFLTEMTRALKEDEAFNSWLLHRTPSHRWGRPDELIGTALFLASEASSFVNGQVLYVDGGVSAVL
ncbi:MAG: SDR family oxidoreductase [Acidobacteriaceae bacterium]|nr:SDR family oxidoreductase [Acidobacteriaceae bacterium]